MIMVTLPWDMITLILSLLPVNSLLRFKCVSKAFKALISSTEFTNLHLLKSRSSNTNRLVILTSLETGTLYTYNLDSYTAFKIPLSKFFNLAASDYGIVVTGSCNGLVCLSSSCSSYKVVLLNPCTLKYHVVPKAKKLKLPVRIFENVRVGFGYDYENGDYKVVRIIDYKWTSPEAGIDGSMFRQVIVYSLKAGSWKLISNSRVEKEGIGRDNDVGVLIGSHLLHWFVRGIQSLDNHIVCFDLCQEKWYQVPLPADYVEAGPFTKKDEFLYMYMVGYYSNYARLGALHGHLCLSVINRQKWGSGIVDLWVMKEYGVKESWVKVLDVLSVYQLPVAYSKDGEGDELLLMNEYNNLSWYDQRTNTATSMNFIGRRDFRSDFVVCWGSTTNIGGRAGIGKRMSNLLNCWRS